MFLLTVQLPQHEQQIEVAQQPSRLLTDVLRSAGLPLNTRCGHRGLCDGCMVELIAGQLQSTLDNEIVAPNGTLLRGCQLRLPQSGSAKIHVPARSLLAHQPQVVASFRLNVPRAHDPLWQRLRIPSSDVDAKLPLLEALAAVVAAELESELPLRWSGDYGHATQPDGEATTIATDADGEFVLSVEHHGDYRQLAPCRLTEPAFGIAVDVGTTTVVVALVDLSTGDVIADASALNAQARLGDNVLTRINLCMTQPRLVHRMQRAVIRNTLSPLISDVLRQADIAPEQLTCMVAAGNTTMLHLLVGVDPTSLGTAPFTPVFLEHKVVSAQELSLDVTHSDKSEVAAEQAECGNAAPEDSGGHSDTATEQNTNSHRTIPTMVVHLLPGAAAYIGADITSGVLASGMLYRDDTCLLVDLGTNGELVLRHAGGIVGCATAAGPAFEGAGLAFGMRAGSGAVGHIELEGNPPLPRIDVIGHDSPAGICGTAYIDFIARARQRGLITPTARFATADHPNIIEHKTHGRALIIAQQDNADPLLITEADMASLLQAKAAIAAGIICLLKEAQLQPQDVQTVYLAGGFGFHMHLDSLLGCGMLPGFRQDQIEAVGNTSLAGAYLSLLDAGALHEIRRVSRQMKVIELNLAPDFEMIYIDQLALP